MIGNALLPDYVLPGVLYGVLVFGLGVSWSAYRAVGWVERMRAWAASVSDSLAAGGPGGRGPAGVPPGDTPAWVSAHGYDYLDRAFQGHDGRGTE